MDSKGRRAQRRKLQQLPGAAGESSPVQVLPAQRELPSPRWTQRVAWVVIMGAAILLLLTASLYLSTYGTWDLFPKGLGFIRFYDFQGASMIDGRWDVPLEAVLGEALIRDGKAYGYFGFAPALPRIVLNYLFPSKFGMWSRISAFACMVSLIGAFLVAARLMKIPRPYQPFLMIFLIGGSTAMFICASSLTYHEASAWGASLSIWAYLCLCKYLQTPRLGFLLLAGVLGFGAFFSRASSGAGVLVCALLFSAGLLIGAWKGAPIQLRRLVNWFALPHPRLPILHAAVLALSVVLISGVFMMINMAKFGSYFEQVPIRYHVQYSPQRLARLNGTLMHPELLAFNAANYFDPRHIRLLHRFPYFGLIQDVEKSSHNLDFVEPYAAFPVAMPALVALSLAGTAAMFYGFGSKNRGYLLILGSALLAGLTLFIFAAISYRYQHDWYPYFFLGSLLGASFLARTPPGWARPTAIAGVIAGGVWSICATIGFIIDLQHSALFGW